MSESNKPLTLCEKLLPVIFLFPSESLHFFSHFVTSLLSCFYFKALNSIKLKWFCCNSFAVLSAVVTGPSLSILLVLWCESAAASKTLLPLVYWYIFITLQPRLALVKTLYCFFEKKRGQACNINYIHTSYCKVYDTYLRSEDFLNYIYFSR